MSLEPDGIAAMVRQIRRVENMLGSGRKEIQAREREHLVTMRKSLFTVRRIGKGDVIGGTDMESKRPGSGISPKYFDRVAGSRAARNIQAGTMLKPGMLSGPPVKF